MKDREQVKKPSKKQIKIFAGIVSFIFLMTGFYILTDKAVSFFRENTIVKYQMVEVKFHQPLEIVSLVELKNRKDMDELTTKISNEAVERYLNPPQEKVCKGESAKINPKEFFATLRTKESSNGKNDNPVALHNYCNAKGMWNEIGYNPQKKFCFKDQEEASLYVAYYVKKNCDGATQAQCECYWNTGDMTDSCHYSRNELSQAN